MSLAILFHFLCIQHVSDINIPIIRSLRLWCCASASNTDTTQTQPHQISNTQRTENKTTDVVIQPHSRKLLMLDILMSETCWVHKKGNKIASDIKLVFYYSTTNVVVWWVIVQSAGIVTSNTVPVLECAKRNIEQCLVLTINFMSYWTIWKALSLSLCVLKWYSFTCRAHNIALT